MKRLLILPILLVLVSCTSIMDTDTPRQRLFAIVSDYKSLQATALEYKSRCEGGMLIDVDCKDHVKQVAFLNSKANSLIQSIDTKTLGDDYTTSIANALFVVTQELTAYLIKIQPKEL